MRTTKKKTCRLCEKKLYGETKAIRTRSAKNGGKLHSGRCILNKGGYLTQAAHQAFERLLYAYKTENTIIRRLLDGRVLLGNLHT